MTEAYRPHHGRRLPRIVSPQWLASFAIALCMLFSAAATAEAETRTLKLYYIHTKERAEITYKRNGRYDQAGLNKINRFLRDWRRNEPTKMDPRLLDLVWEVYKRSGARDHIHVVSAYRSPATNSMLRKRSKGVANKSQHMLGKAMDFYIPGVKLARLRAEGLKAQVGGVGYYPASGSPFVHLDVGNVRHWPRMNRSQLLAVFPDGKTVHVPTDGKPLPGYNQALASYKSRKQGGGTAVAFAAAERKGGGGFLSALFGGGADEAEEESGEVAVVASNDREASPGRRQPKAVVAAAPEEPQPTVRATRPASPLPGVEAAPPQPVVVEEPQLREEPTPETIIAALPARAVPLPLSAPRPKADVGATDVGALALAAEPVVGETVANAAAAPAEAEIALNIPVPSRRPDYAAEPVAEPVAIAAVNMPDSAPVSALLPRLTRGEGQKAIEDVIADGGAPVVMAALPVASPAARTAAPRDTLLSGGAIDKGAKTTAKASRPSARDSRPDPKPVTLPAQPDDARWAFHKDFVINSGRDATAPAYARNLVRAAPQAVYTAGFQQVPAVEDPTRFFGKAVAFLPVAKFQGTN